MFSVLVCSAALSAGSVLAPKALEPLPLGAVRPEGWLKVQLEQMCEGLCGRLYEHSPYLTPTNGWLTATGVGWEEQPYWFRGFIKTAALTGNARMLGVTKDWVEKILATRDADGWYGPHALKEHRCTTGKVISDIWGHMVMNEALLGWYEYSGDRRVLDLLLGFYRHLAQMDETRFIPSFADQEGSGRWTWGIQTTRAGDALPAIFACYERTKEPWLLDLAFRVWRHRRRPQIFAAQHTVNFAQLFGYGTVMSRLTRRPSDRDSAAFWFDLQMKAWGATPRCGYASDEQVRVGCTDPRYGTETCSWAELIRSFGLVGEVTGETVWADRTEDVMFNWYPIAFTPGWKELHYITAGNQVNLDARTDHNYFNRPPMAAYSAGTSYRCCQHNASFGLPHFCESLVRTDADGALVFWLYAPHRGRAALSGGRTAEWRLTTEYPFRETAHLTVSGASKLRFRVPGWCRAFEVRDGARTLARTETPGGWLDVSDVADGAELDLSMTAECAWRTYPRHGGLSVERGPLTYALGFEPVVSRVPRPQFAWDGAKWYPEERVSSDDATRETMVQMELPSGARWNFALDRDAPPRYRTRPFTEDCFRLAAAPAEIVVKGRALAEWTLQDNQPAELQDSPAYTTAPAEDIRLVPMCCARLHVTVFPEATTTAARGFPWRRTPPSTNRKDRPAALPLIPESRR